MEHIFKAKEFSGNNFEFLVSYLQEQNKGKILCVQDGWKYLVYDELDSIPPGLIVERVKKNKTLKTKEYHYRDPSDHLYVFFLYDVHVFIQNGRQKNFEHWGLEIPTSSAQDTTAIFLSGSGYFTME